MGISPIDTHTSYERYPIPILRYIPRPYVLSAPSDQFINHRYTVYCPSVLHLMFAT